MKFLLAFVWKGQLTGFSQEIAVKGVTEHGLTAHQEQGKTVSVCITPLSQKIFQYGQREGEKENAPSKILGFLKLLN